MNPDISIIIPCYNRLELLKLTLKSVEKAIHELSAQIVLVDDGSETPLEPLLQEFKHLPIKFIRQRNSGLTISRYNGLMAATGHYIQFLDSDDQITASKFINQLKAMTAHKADVSHTNVLQATLSQEGNLEPLKTDYTQHSENPAEFYIYIQPAPHSPVFKRTYLLKNLSKPFIPLSRAYDSIGEVWFYYNLAPFQAKIIKIQEASTLVIHHEEERLTNHWERLGLCALSLMLHFSTSYPKNEPYSDDSKKYVGRAAFNSFRGLPFNIYKPFQYAFIKIWKVLGSTKDLKAGKKFQKLSSLVGPVQAAVFFKYLSWNDYSKIKTIDKKELVDKTDQILN